MVFVLVTLAVIEAVVVSIAVPDPGTTVETTLVRTSDADAVRGALSPLGLDGLEVRHVGREAGGDRCALSCAALSDERVGDVRQTLDQTFAVATDGGGTPLYSASTVGARFSSQLCGSLVAGSIIVDALLALAGLLWIGRGPAAA